VQSKVGKQEVAGLPAYRYAAGSGAEHHPHPWRCTVSNRKFIMSSSFPSLYYIFMMYGKYRPLSAHICFDLTGVKGGLGAINVAYMNMDSERRTFWRGLPLGTIQKCLVAWSVSMLG